MNTVWTKQKLSEMESVPQNPNYVFRSIVNNGFSVRRHVPTLNGDLRLIVYYQNGD